nr:hypothetical protein [Ktedonobacterales bacterium]
MSARFASTTRLSNIIQMISLARQSGILRAIRGHGPARELGQIRFVDGEPVTALLGQVVGQGALNVLMNWGDCLYAFDEGTQAAAAEGEGASWGSDPATSGVGSASPPPDPSLGSWPSFGYGGSAPSAPSAVPPSYAGAPSRPSSVSPSYSSPPMGAPPRYAGMPPAPPNPYAESEAEINALLALRPQGAAPAVATMPVLPPFSPDMPRSVPYRTALAQHMDALPLDRRERM